MKDPSDMQSGKGVGSPFHKKGILILYVRIRMRIIQYARAPLTTSWRGLRMRLAKLNLAKIGSLLGEWLREWVRNRVRVGARESNTSFFFSCLTKCGEHLCLR